jgi:CRISPR-associated protein Cmr5
MSKPSLDQQRAAHALARIEELRKEDAKIAGKYAGYVKALPATILSNGLGQALATELAADDKAHDKLAEHVARWLLEASGSPYGPLPNDGHAKALLDRIFKGDQRAYVWAQAEAIAYVGWLKKLAVAFLSNEPSPSPEAAADAR